MNALSFLGTGNYSETTYKFGDKSCKTNLMPFAVTQFFELETLFIAQTKEAKERNGSALRNACDYAPIDIPSGKTNEELWQMFSAIADAIPPDSTLVVDITHGFRSQPMIALAIVLFLQTAKNVKIEKIIYGAFNDKSEDNISPVFDLTPFLEIINWTSATKQFIQYGDAAEMKSQLRETQKQTYAPDSPFRALNLNKVGDTLEQLTNALSLVRPNEVLTASTELGSVLKKATPDLENIIASKPFTLLLEKVNARFQPFAQTTDLFSDVGFKAQAQMIQFYLETEQYQQAILLGREAIVSKICVQQKIDPTDNHKREKQAEADLNTWSKPLSEGNPIAKEYKPYETVAKIWQKTIQIRNDIAHAGMKKNPADSKGLIKHIKKVSEEIIEFIQSAS